MAGTSALIVIDGSYGEGGGALLRTALCMSAMTMQGLRVENVRGAGRFTGLDIEDRVLLHALRKICKADVVGDENGSTTLTFLPKGRPTGLNGELESLQTDLGRVPNALVVLSALLPILARTGVYSSISAKGETYGFNTLSYDYFSNVTLEALKKTGLYAITDQLKPGFGRQSSGEVSLEVEPSALSGVDWTDRGSLRSIQAVVATAGLPQMVGDRAISHLKNLASSSGLALDAEHSDFGGRQSGAFVTIWARYERGLGGGVAMGSRGVKAETLAQAAFDQLLRWMSTSATVDEHLADQLLMTLAFAEGDSTFSVPKLTQRLLTAIWVIKQFTPIHITVRGLENGPGTITIHR
jgi:RNA 3'-terminal phosphate cyclase (ATP)